MSAHARPSALTRAVCSFAPAGRPVLSAGLVAALVAGAGPLLLGPGPALAQAAPTASATATPAPEATPVAEPAPEPAATAGATPVAADPSATPTATPTATTPAPTSPTPAPTEDPDAATAPVLRMSTSAAVVGPGQVLTLGARMYRGTHSPGAGVLLDVVGRKVGGGWARVARVRTDSTGLGVVRLTPRTTTEYQVRSPGDARSLAASTAPARVEVQPRLGASLNRGVVRAGDGAVVSGVLQPAYLGAVVRIDRLVSGRWQPVSAVRTGAGGAYRWSVRPGAVGSYSFRAVLPGTTQYRAATSKAVTLVVDSRDLRRGARGPEVALLQRRLQAFGADVGRVDGVYGGDLLHAVIAFQKTQGLPRTGVYDARTRAALASPRAVRLRYPTSGRSVEVDLSKQVLYLAQGGRVTRIVDISSGNDELYTVDGVTERAFTPRGRYVIQRKINGVRVSRLGELYRPAYFHRGWAVHGSPSVPTYPASHGCIRVTNSAMDRLYGLLTVGVPVAVYD